MNLFQECLYEMMANISERGFCAGWKSDLEYDLWMIVESGPAEYGLIEIDADRIAKLQELSTLANGWILFSGDHPEWVPMDIWLVQYQIWKAKRESIREPLFF